MKIRNTIDDGCFIPNAGAVMNANSCSWKELPASYHNRAAAFSFVDGHASLHRWLNAGALVQARSSSATPAVSQPPSASAQNDFDWVMAHLSVVAN